MLKGGKTKRMKGGKTKRTINGGKIKMKSGKTKGVLITEAASTHPTPALPRESAKQPS
jgi:hypothetical protein